jgi:hypothetical protein
MTTVAAAPLLHAAANATAVELASTCLATPVATAVAAGARWMMLCIMCNFTVALVSFVLYTFIYPPPLEAGTPPQHPTRMPATTDTSNRDQTAAAAGTASATGRNFPWSRRKSPDARTAHHLDGQPSPFERQAGQRSDSNMPHREQMQLTDMAAVAGGAGRAGTTGAGQQAEGEGGSTQQKQSALAAAVRRIAGLLTSLPGMLKVWVNGLPAWFRTAVLEEEDIK